MNVGEMIDEIPRRWPEAEIRTDEEGLASWHWFRVDLPNKWKLSVAYGVHAYCGNYGVALPDPLTVDTVEIAIFDAQGEWFLPEGAENIAQIPDHKPTGVLTYQTSDQLFAVIDYIGGM